MSIKKEKKKKKWILSHLFDFESSSFSLLVSVFVLQ